MSGPGPLADVRVVDLCDDLGRYSSKLLAELGADVVRVGRGESGPALTEDGSGPGLLDWWHDGGTRRVDLDLDAGEAAIDRLRSLITSADILIEAEAPGSLAARGLGVEEIAALNPRLAHVSITPYGSTGPKSQWRSSDLVAQAEGGWVSVTGEPDRPIALWGRQGHTVGGFYAAICGMAGMIQARATGRGSWFDLSLHEALISCSEHLLMYWWHPEALESLGAPIADRQRSLHWIRAFEVVPCERGHCMVSPAAGGLVGLIAWLKGRGFAQEIPDDPEADELLGLVAPMMTALKDIALTMDATELMEAGQSLHVPFGESYDVTQVAACPQHEFRGFFRAVDGEDDIRIPGPFAHFADSPAPAPRRPPEKSSGLNDVIESWASAGAPSEPSDPDRDISDGPMSSVRIVDFTHVLAGPFATRVLGDLGADVIRMQTEIRTAGSTANDYPYQIMWGRNKRSIQLEMKHADALDVLRQLVEKADIVVDNFSAGVLESWGAGPEQLAKWNPNLITMAMSGAGTEGPWADYVTYAPTVQALCGLTALTGPEGEPDCGPGIAHNDHLSGLSGAVALLGALHHRDTTGRGQHIDLSQLEVGTYLVGPALVDWFATGRAAEPTGNTDPYADHVVNDVFEASDGDWVAVTIATAAQAEQASGAVADLGSLAESAKDVVTAWIAGRPAADAVEVLQNAGIPAGVVQTARHLMEDDAQLVHRDWLRTATSSIVGEQTTERFPARIHLDGGSHEIELSYTASAYLGEHNFEVYPELLGWDEVQVAEALGSELLL